MCNIRSVWRFFPSPENYRPCVIYRHRTARTIVDSACGYFFPKLQELSSVCTIRSVWRVCFNWHQHLSCTLHFPDCKRGCEHPSPHTGEDSYLIVNQGIGCNTNSSNRCRVSAARTIVATGPRGTKRNVETEEDVTEKMSDTEKINIPPAQGWHVPRQAQNRDICRRGALTGLITTAGRHVLTLLRTFIGLQTGCEQPSPHKGEDSYLIENLKIGCNTKASERVSV